MYQSIVELICLVKPTFNPDASALRRDVVLLDRWSVATASPYNLGDIVTLWSPSSPNTLSSKRIIALEGDIVTTLSPYPEKKVLVFVPASLLFTSSDKRKSVGQTERTLLG